MNHIALTLDIDWAPDFTIDFVAKRLLERSVRATWFVTHRSPAISRLREHPELFELGIHPNFLPGSTHGETHEDVLSHCMSLVPEAVSMRTHALYQSTPLLSQVLSQTPIRVDASLYLPHAPALRPVEYECNGHTLLRIPYFWEDDCEMERISSCWHLTPLLECGEGLKVFDFHPIHVYLNSSDMTCYQELKRAVPKLANATHQQAVRHISQGVGTQTLFRDLVNYLASTQRSLRISDIQPQMGGLTSKGHDTHGKYKS